MLPHKIDPPSAGHCNIKNGTRQKYGGDKNKREGTMRENVSDLFLWRGDTNPALSTTAMNKTDTEKMDTGQNEQKR